MPHITVHAVPGHSQAEKHALALRIQKAVSEEFHVEQRLVSVSVMEVPAKEWRTFISQVHADSFYVEPEYLKEGR